MRIYNTMTRRKEELVPLTEGKVNIYACGPTVYNKIHIGNARQICVFDTLVRYLKYRGYDVKFVQNFTDVDDRIIARANERGVTSKEYSEEMIREYFIDSRGLNVKDADIHPKVTENIDIIIDIVNVLLEKGFAYCAGGDVYFETSKFADYGKLSHMPLDELMAGASERVDADDKKRNAMDFAVWKGAKEGEPYWEAPFGNGRPGWHIECSAMSRHYIGNTLDIHGGGSDLIFPHHENEIAQSECATGCTLANIWMHNGMLNVDNKKMSKSKNNFFLVRELAEIYGYEPLRFMLLQAQYRSQLNYTEEVIQSAVASLDRLRTCAQTMERAIPLLNDGEADIFARELVGKRTSQFIEAMDDDLNTADGISTIFELVRDINTALLDKSTSKGSALLMQKTFNEFVDVLGLLFENKTDAIPEEVTALVEQRKAARKEKNFALADEIRDKITALGYSVEETRQGTVIKKL